MKKRIFSLFLVVVMLANITACGFDPQNSSEATVPFTDDAGRRVDVPAEISRIVPAGPLAQMILFAIAPDMVVGLSSKWQESAVGIIDRSYMDLPYLGQIYGSADLSVEGLALAAPHLIIDIG